jgi:hypothetical protein
LLSLFAVLKTQPQTRANGDRFVVGRIVAVVRERFVLFVDFAELQARLY